MTIDEDIHWHDSLILSVRISAEKDLIEKSRSRKFGQLDK